MIAGLDGGSRPGSLFQIVKVGITQSILGVPLWRKLLRSNRPKELIDLHGGMLPQSGSAARAERRITEPMAFAADDAVTADLDSDGTVGILDLLALLAAWGPNPGHSADFDGDGNVGILDLLTLLANWGPCA